MIVEDRIFELYPRLLMNRLRYKRSYLIRNSVQYIFLFFFQLSNEECMKEIVFDKQPPEIEVHIVNAEPSWPWLLTVSFHFSPENKAKSLFSANH